MTRTLIASSLCLILAACGGQESKQSSTAKLDAVEVEPGSVSDSMIILDNVAEDGTPAEPSEGGESEDKGEAAADAAKDSEAGSNGDAGAEESAAE